ncbi:hypothetical protein SDC9_203851 [bioreactor metagenome]|uniref:Uncharacterized protein n=1 Tax=bioreactor metagenome TaxID=1076179 RepID=A0A645IXK8_9ZZZZ
MISVTSPTARLRAEEPAQVAWRSAGAISWANRARSAPSITWRPWALVTEESLSAAIQRRTVSELTPRRVAASEIRYCAMPARLAQQMRLEKIKIGADEVVVDRRGGRRPSRVEGGIVGGESHGSA